LAGHVHKRTLKLSQQLMLTQ